MLEVSEKYREMAESDAREVSVKVNIGDIELTNDDIIELNIYRSMGESGFSIGSVVTTRIRLLALMNLLYAGEVAMDVSVGFGFDEENASEYVQLGRFYGCATNPSFDTAQVEIIGYDKLGSGSFLNRRFHGDFAPEFPCTVQEILDYICERSNLECDFTCNSYSVSELPLKDKTRDAADYERYYTYKEMLGFVAAAHSAVAAMDSNNKLVFLSVGEETETVDSADCIDFSFKSAEEFTVKGILLHVQDVLSTGSTNIFINDDSKIAYDGETTDGVVEASCPFGSIAMAEELWQQLGEFSYYSCEFTRRGRGWTELGDIIYANDTLSGRTLLKHEGKMIAQTVEWNFSAAEGFMEHIISKAESPEESTDRLGNGNSINNRKDGASENVEKIKFTRNEVEYGAVGIHDIDGETGVALSITEASKWLALVDENGEKILEYVPNKREEGKPYEVKKGLWFYPVKSQNVPSFDGFYFPYPANFIEFQQKGEFDPSAVDEDSPFYSIVNSTMFCLSDAKVNELKNAGFNHVYNAAKFKDDIWVINGYESAFTYMTGWNGNTYYTKIDILEQSFIQPGGISWESIMMPVAPYVPVEENGDIVKYQGSTGEIVASSAQDGRYKVIGFSSFNCSVGSEVYKNVWKDVIDAAVQPSDEIPKNTVRIYKDIFLMNGAKILNEDV